MTANYIDATGLVTQTLAEIITELETGFKSIYGADISVDANSPDGQMINLFSQAKIDMLDCITQVYGSFSPTSAIGVSLDNRCAINGVTRNGASKTTVLMTVTTDRVVNLVGSSSNTGTPFTVADAAGNQFYLDADTTTTNGVNSALPFTAAIAGNTLITVGGITKIVTITLGVLIVTNPAGAVIQGVDEETDAALRYRRAISVAMPSSGYALGLKSALLALNGVQYCEVYENNTDIIDSYNIPPHSIWVVIEGGTDAEIADVIYKKRNAGCGMTGATTSAIDIGNGFDMPIKFSDSSLTNLYIDLTMQSISPSDYSIDDAEKTAMKAYIASNVKYSINQKADYSAIAAKLKSEYPYAVITSGWVGITGATGAAFIVPSTIDKRFVVDSTRISITATA